MARAFNQDNLGCWGAKRVLGFIHSGVDEQPIDILINVERYTKSADIIQSMFASNSPVTAEGTYLIFKRCLKIWMTVF